MNIHEYQAKSLFKCHGVAVPEGKLVEEGSDVGGRAIKAAEELAKERNAKVFVVKAQVHAGGRGKAGGVKVCKTMDEVKAAAEDIMGKKLVTPQTGEEGKIVHKLWIEEGSAIASELYLSVLIDRATSKVLFMASTEGGMDIEEVAEKTPEKIVQVLVDPTLGFQPYHARKLAKAFGMDKELSKQAGPFFKGIYETFMGSDAEMVEINPLIITEDKKLMALDAKMNFDDNALFRQKTVLEMRDLLEENPQDIEAF